ncbi:MAG TPA: PhzF family phenazine biosynthesis protein [Nannocystis sp.]|jgi:PhzF family phenazine biosynthesis protein
MPHTNTNNSGVFSLAALNRSSGADEGRAALPCYQVDAFTHTRFAGNPAAVVTLDRWLPDPLLQVIAAENSVPETAFLVAKGGDYHLRWFTPEVEVDLCGHATLAAAFVLCTRVHPGRRSLVFHSQSGDLAVTRDGDEYTLDFPARPPVPADSPAGLVEAMGCTPREVLRARDWLLVLDDAAAVRACRPDMGALAALPDIFGVCVTAPGDIEGVDFVSRFFAPSQGIPEDPVTGSAHCTLAPYWAARLDKHQLRARQLSRRSGELRCTLVGDRVHLSGHAVLTRTGFLLLDDEV